MPDVMITHSDHVCRLATSIVGAIVVSFCAVVLFFKACRWIDSLLDTRQYRLSTQRKERIEKVRWNAAAEREGWRELNESLIQAVAGYAKENHDMREFMKKAKVIDIYEGRKKDDEGTADDAC